MTIGNLGITAWYHKNSLYQNFSNEFPLTFNRTEFNKKWITRKFHSIFFDISKAFDTIDHTVIIQRLHYQGIRDIPLNCLRVVLPNALSMLSAMVIIFHYRNRNRCATRLYPWSPFILVYIKDIHTVSDNLNFILNTDGTTLSSPMCSFTSQCNGNIELVNVLINSELNKIDHWLVMNKLSLNVQKNSFMIYHYR